MTGKTHQIIGIGTGVAFFILSKEPTYNPATLSAVVAFGYVGALLPDIDQPTGKLWHLLPFGDEVGKLSDPFFEHRNITHSLLGAGLVGLAFYYLFSLFPRYWGIDAGILFWTTMIAYLSHLICDLWTNEGIPLFLPYKKFIGFPPKPFDGMRVATGKWFENLVLFPLASVILIIFLLVNLTSLKVILFK